MTTGSFVPLVTLAGCQTLTVRPVYAELKRVVCGICQCAEARTVFRVRESSVCAVKQGFDLRINVIRNHVLQGLLRTRRSECGGVEGSLVRVVSHW